MKPIEIGAQLCLGRRNTLQDDYYATAEELSCFAAVFDGHGRSGDAVANRATEAMGMLGSNIPADMTETFAGIDQTIQNIPWISGGTTATTVRVRPLVDKQGRLFKEIITNNVGDSPALLVDPRDPFREGGTIQLSTYHDVSNQDEVERMRAAGYDLNGKYFRSRRDGNYNDIMVSRAIGDRDLPGLISCPSRSRLFSRAERLLLVASDGVLRPETQRAVIETMCQDFRLKAPMGHIATHLAEKFANITGDNATAVVAHLPSTQSVNAW